MAHLDGEHGALLLEGRRTKNRRPGIQPLPRGLVDTLLAFGKSGKAKALYARYGTKGRDDVPAERLLSVSDNTGRDLKADLETAKVPAFGPGLGKVDFHSLRVAYVTPVVEAGASVREAQTLARHQTPNLTLEVYAETRDVRLGELTEKVAESVLLRPDHALSVHRKAAGAESLDVKTLGNNALGQQASGAEAGSRTRKE